MKSFPEYLRRCVTADPGGEDEAVATGSVRCECGSSDFEVLYPGKTVELDGSPYPCGLDTDMHGFFLIEAKCTGCERRYLLFDQDFHGWDGYQCHDAEQAAVPRPPLAPWICLTCGQLGHRISIKLQHADLPEYKDLLRRANRAFDEDEWLLSFEWIFMTIECANCGLVTQEWVSYETA